MVGATTNFRESFHQLLLIRPHERQVAWYLFGVLFLTGLGLGLGRGVNDALFLHRFGVDFLPATYVLVGAAMFVAGMLYMALLELTAPEQLFHRLLHVLGLVLLMIWACIAWLPEAGWIYPTLYLLYEVTSDLLLVHAASYIAQNLSFSQSNRLTPFVLAGAQVGMVIGGLLLSILSGFIPIHHALLVWAATATFLAVALNAHHRRTGVSPFYFPPPHRRFTLGRAAESILKGVRYWRQCDLVYALGIGMFFTVMAFYTLGFIVNKVYAESFAVEAELSRFLGLLIAFNAAAGLAIQMLLTGRLLDRFGLRPTSLVFPVSMLASNLLLALSLGLPAAVAGSFARDALMTAVRNPTYSLFFRALPKNVQGRSRALMVGLVIPVSLMASGGLLYLAIQADSLVPALGVGVASSLLYLAYSVRTNNAYRATLIDTLKDSVFLGQGHEPPVVAAAKSVKLLAQLERGVGSDVRDVVLSYARYLLAWFPEDAPRIILEHMARKPPAIRIELAELLLPHGIESLGDLLLRLHETAEDAEDRFLIHRLLLKLRDKRAMSMARRYAASDNPWELGVWAWYRLMDESETAVAEVQRSATHLIGQPDASALRVGLALLEDVPSTADLDKRLVRLLEGADGDIRSRILRHFRNQSQAEPRELADALTRLLEDDQDAERRALAVEVLARLPGEVTQTLWPRLYRAEPYETVRVALLHRWRQSVASDDGIVFDGLLNDATLNFHARLTLLREGGDDLFPLPALENFVARQVEAAESLRKLCDEVHARPDEREGRWELLGIVLGERLRQATTLALEALRFIDNAQAVQVAQAALRVPDLDYRAHAIEVIRNLQHRDAGRALARLLESNSEMRSATSPPRPVQEVIDDCTSFGDPWLARIAGAVR